MTIPPEERFTFTPKGQVILRGKPNKAVQVNCLFPRLSIPPLFFFFSVSLVDFESIRTFSKLKPDLYCTGQLFTVDTRPGETRIPHEWPSFIEYRSPRNQDVGFFSNVRVGIRLKYLSLTPWNATQDLLIADKLRCISRYQRFFSNRLIKRYDRVYSQIKRGGIKVEELFLKESL